MTWPPITGVGLIDAGLVERLKRLNEIPGVETLQSCSGAHTGAERPAHVWLKGRASDTACEAFLALPWVETVSVLYGREPFPVTEIVFACPEGFDELIEYLESPKQRCLRCAPRGKRRNRGR